MYLVREARQNQSRDSIVFYYTRASYTQNVKPLIHEKIRTNDLEQVCHPPRLSAVLLVVFWTCRCFLVRFHTTTNNNSPLTRRLFSGKFFKTLSKNLLKNCHHCYQMFVLYTMHLACEKKIHTHADLSLWFT